jgi:hypothetical protein
MEEGKSYDDGDAVHDDKGGADGKAVRHNGVCLSLLVEVSCKRPGRCIGIVRLYGCATPRRVAVAVGEKLLVACDDGDHDCVVDEAAKNRAIDLR